MPEFTFLGGQVRKWSLPIVEGGSGPFEPKRLMLPQGELAWLYNADDGIRYIACLELRAGTVRGNHYHLRKEEWVYVIQGELELLLQDRATQARETVPLRTGDLAFIPTGVAHAMRAVQSGHAVEFSSSRFEPSDSYRFPVG